MRTKLPLGLFSAAMSLLLTCGAYAAGSGPTLYRVINLGNPEGGTVSQGTSDNQEGWVVGFSDLPGDAVMQAELWRGGGAQSLGTLGGPNSSVAWPNRNHHGLIAGIAETSELQPLHEQWSCGLAVFPTVDGHVCRGFAWRNGVMTGLPTLGGDNGFATGVNERGQIVGWAEDNTHDPTCNEFTNTGQVLQFEAVMWAWDDGHYRATALPPYPGDLDGAATAINERGEVVGITGICDAAIGGGTAEHMILWRNGRVALSLPTLGGTYWNTPMDINNRGDVAGFSDRPGDGPTIAQANFHAFFWSARPYSCDGKTVSGTCDLGTLTVNGASDAGTEALGMNDRDQVVGVSFPSQHAFIWQNGMMTDLNSALVPGTSLILTDAQDINDRGEITGIAADPSTGALVSFLAVPVN
jgi:probable HAF family extracellular repeat protein